MTTNWTAVSQDDCNWNAVSVPIEIVTTCALTLVCVATLRSAVAWVVTQILQKSPPPWFDFPMWEGLTFVVQLFGYFNAVLKGLKDSCNAWMLACAAVLLMVPVIFAVFALVWLRLHRDDGNIAWKHTGKPGFGDLWKRLSNSETFLTKYFSLQIWCEQRNLKGVWDSESNLISFWNFLIQEYRIYEVRLVNLLWCYALILQFHVLSGADESFHTVCDLDDREARYILDGPHISR